MDEQGPEFEKPALLEPDLNPDGPLAAIMRDPGVTVSSEPPGWSTDERIPCSSEEAWARLREATRLWRAGLL